MSILFKDDCALHPDFFDYRHLILNRYVKHPMVSFIGACDYIDDKGTNTAKIIKTNAEWK